MAYIQRADPVRHPRHVAMRAWIASGTFIQSWLDTPPSELAREARTSWAERIDMVCEDLARLDDGRPIVAEGPGFFPDVVQPLLPDRSRAMWLIPTAPFKRSARERHGKSGWRFETTDPDLALAHHIARDLLLAQTYRQEVIAAHLPWRDVSGSEDAAMLARHVSRHFGFG